MPPSRSKWGRSTQHLDDLLFAKALPLHGESSCHHYQENSPSAWTDSRGTRSTGNGDGDLIARNWDKCRERSRDA
jgi:hypothetical protein